MVLGYPRKETWERQDRKTRSAGKARSAAHGRVAAASGECGDRGLLPTNLAAETGEPGERMLILSWETLLTLFHVAAALRYPMLGKGAPL